MAGAGAFARLRVMMNSVRVAGKVLSGVKVVPMEAVLMSSEFVNGLAGGEVGDGGVRQRERR